MMSVEASPAVGVPRGDGPIYDLPYGSVQLAGPSALASFNLASSLQRPADFEDEEEEEEEEDESEDSSKKGKGKKKKTKSEVKGEKDAKTGRRKIKIEFIEDDARRHITFSKRKAGIMKKAYELATLTGTQVLLLVVSQTGLVYTFTTPKLQALVTQTEGRNLIQACLNAPDPPPNDESPESDGSSSQKRAGELMPGTGPRKRNRNNSTATDESAPSKRGRGRPRKGTVTSQTDSPAPPPQRFSDPMPMQQQYATNYNYFPPHQPPQDTSPWAQQGVFPPNPQQPQQYDYSQPQQYW